MKKQILIAATCFITLLAFSCDQQRHISKTKTEPTEKDLGSGNEGGASQAGANEGTMVDNQTVPDSLADTSKAVDRGLPVSNEDYEDLKKRADKPKKDTSNQ